MSHLRIPALAAAVLAVALGPTSALADRDLTRPAADSAAGDWTCQMGKGAIGTLSLRANSYVLNRRGTSMAGEYQQARQRVVVTNGPLRGLGIEAGILATGATERRLDFPTVGGTALSCREVL